MKYVFNNIKLSFVLTYLNSITISNALNINIISLPYDLGANKVGSRNAFNVLKEDLIDSNKIKLNKIIELEANSRHLRIELGNAYIESWKSLDTKKIPLLIGGDHTCAIPNIFASNGYCIANKEKLGVLWIDAHADFNTIQTSPTKNLHGVPVSVLCGHTLPMLSFGEHLDPSQFLYYGLRDFDSLEFDRIQEHNMKILDNELELKEWCKNYDKIHISFDMDSLDPSVFSSVNTPVKNGLTLENISYLFNHVKNTKKLQSMDIVEYNPELGNQNEVILKILEDLL